jgi:hypothetical protein
VEDRAQALRPRTQAAPLVPRLRLPAHRPPVEELPALPPGARRLRRLLGLRRMRQALNVFPATDGLTAPLFRLERLAF